MNLVIRLTFMAHMWHHLTSVSPPCSWRIKSGRWSRTSSRWVRRRTTICRLTGRYWPLTRPVRLPPDTSQGFNDGLEELCKIQKGWAIPDKEQRDFIRQSQKKVVSDAYRSFLQRWGTVNSLMCLKPIFSHGKKAVHLKSPRPPWCENDGRFRKVREKAWKMPTFTD